MFLIPPNPRLRRFHVHLVKFSFHKPTMLIYRAFWRHLSLKKISLLKKEWSKGIMRRLWFYEIFDAVLFLRLMSVGEIANWVLLDGKGRTLSKRGVVRGTSVFRTKSVDSKQQKDSYVVSYNDEPCLVMVIICTYLQCWSENFFAMVGVGGDQNMHHVLFTRH